MDISQQYRQALQRLRGASKVFSLGGSFLKVLGEGALFIWPTDSCSFVFEHSPP